MFGRKKKKSSSENTVTSALLLLKQSGAVDHPNTEAYKWLDEALFASSRVGKDERKSGIVEYDNIFPTTADQTEKMRQCIDRVKEVAGDKSEEFLIQRINLIAKIVDWSSTRHSTFQWILVAGVCLTLFIFNLMHGGKEENVEKTKAELARVEAWHEQDTTIAYDVLVIKKYSGADKFYANRFNNANTHKFFILNKLKTEAERATENVEKYRNYADTASTKQRKEQYLESSKENKQQEEAHREEYDRVNKLKFKDFKKEAIKDREAAVKSRKSAMHAMFRWVLFFAILIPLYFVAQRPYGYTITRLKTESAIVGGIQKLLMGLASGFAVGGLAMQYIPTKYVSRSSGRVVQEGDTAEFMSHLVIKFGIIAIGVFIFCSASSLLMIYLTVQGLRRNYNWNDIIAKAKSHIPSK